MFGLDRWCFGLFSYFGGVCLWPDCLLFGCFDVCLLYLMNFNSIVSYSFFNVDGYY